LILIFQQILLLLLILIFQQVQQVLVVLYFLDYLVDQLHRWIPEDQMDQHQ
jgi:hypothetical protein